MGPVKTAGVLLALALAALVAGAAGSNPAGQAFLEENGKKDGVVTLPSGLQYKVLKRGAGTHHPTVDSRCSCHYHGTLIDGTVFDSSVDRGQPIDFAPNQVISGWTEIMQLMVEGDKFEIYLPSELAYGARGSPPKIGPDEVLIFTIEIIEIHGGKVPAISCDPETLANCNEKETAFVDKARSKLAGGEAAEIKRLEGMLASKMKPDLREWVQRRLNILRRLESAGAAKDEL